MAGMTCDNTGTLQRQDDYVIRFRKASYASRPVVRAAEPGLLGCDAANQISSNSRRVAAFQSQNSPSDAGHIGMPAQLVPGTVRAESAGIRWEMHLAVNFRLAKHWRQGLSPVARGYFAFGVLNMSRLA